MVSRFSPFFVDKIKQSLAYAGDCFVLLVVNGVYVKFFLHFIIYFKSHDLSDEKYFVRIFADTGNAIFHFLA